MIVKTVESPVFYRKKRKGLPGKNPVIAKKEEKSFDQYLVEAFGGEVVQKDKSFSRNISELTQENLIRLSNM